MAQAAAQTNNFNDCTSPTAYEVHVVLQDRDGQVQDLQFEATHPVAVLLKNHANLPELDTSKLEKDGVLNNTVSGARYYDWDSFQNAVTQSYNSAMVDASQQYIKLFGEAYPGEDGSIEVNHVNDVLDKNKLDHSYMSGLLGNMISELSQPFMQGSYDDITSEARKVQENLDTVGHLALQTSEFAFENIKPYMPGVDVRGEVIDFNVYHEAENAASACALQVKP